jgi:hypothetical protein
MSAEVCGEEPGREPSPIGRFSGPVSLRAPNRRVFMTCTSTSRRSITGLLALFIAVGLLGAPGSAWAVNGYRYWGYFHWDSGAKTWQFAKTGPDAYIPPDKSVEGWRFAVNVGNSGREPRAAGNFAAICGHTQAKAGQKRVAVVIDYGLAKEAPGGEHPPAPRGACAVVPKQATGVQVLQAVANVRTEKGFTCGIDGYPATECPTELKDVSVPADDKPVHLKLPRAAQPGDRSGFPWAPVAVVAIVAAIGAAAALAFRRRA